MTRTLRPSARAPFALLALLALFGAGCGQQTGVVSGKVTIEGKPLPRGLITFLSDVGNKDAFNAAIIDGEYRTAAIPCGPAKIMILPTAGPPKSEKGGNDLQPGARAGAAAKPVVPDRYQSPDTSGFEITVKPGDNDFTADLKRDK
jgi:hypothetical protein